MGVLLHYMIRPDPSLTHSAAIAMRLACQLFMTPQEFRVDHLIRKRIDLLKKVNHSNTASLIFMQIGARGFWTRET